jgi:DNA-binding NtrC family response regulator
MSLRLQARVISILREDEIARVAGGAKRPARFRLIASVKSENGAVTVGALHPDIRNCLTIAVITLAPLCDRREDIRALIQFYLERFSAVHARSCPSLGEALLDELLTYSWPGNVRELQNYVRRYVVVGEHSLPRSTPTPTRRSDPADAGTSRTARLSSAINQDTAERLELLDALQRTHWNRLRAARVLNISYNSLLGRIRRHGLDHPSSEE